MDWNHRYLTEDTPWDKGAAAPSIPAFVDAHQNALFQGSRVYVPGCGLGHDAALLAELGFSVVGVDIAPLAVENARATYGERAQLRFQVDDLFEKTAHAEYDWVWEHTCFCAIHPSLRRAYMQSISKKLKVGGYLAGVFFLTPDMPVGEGPPFGASVEEILSEAEGLFELVSESEPSSSYEGREGRERMLLFRKVC